MVPGIIYLLLTAASIVYWSAGLDFYRCPEGCEAVNMVLQRPLVLWGVAYFAMGSLVCFSGFAAQQRLVALLLLGGGTAVHGTLLVTARQGTGGLCAACAVFLMFELFMLAYLLFSPPVRFHRIPAILTGAVLAAAILVLALNPAAPAIAPAGDKGSPAPPGLTAGSMLAVTTPQGTGTVLNLKHRPALIWTWWCPHCLEDLRRASRQPVEKRPYLVLTFTPGMGDIDQARAKLLAAGLRDDDFYLMPEAKVESVPTLLYWDEQTQIVWAR